MKAPVHSCSTMLLATLETALCQILDMVPNSCVSLRFYYSNANGNNRAHYSYVNINARRMTRAVAVLWNNNNSIATPAQIRSAEIRELLEFKSQKSPATALAKIALAVVARIGWPG